MARSFFSILKTPYLMFPPPMVSNTIVYACNAYGILYYIKHSFLAWKYKSLIQSHGVYGPDEPDDDLNKIFGEMISKDLKDVASENTEVRLYLTPGMETTHIGTLGTVAGGYVGVPVFYEFKKKQDVEGKIMAGSISYDTMKDEEELYDCFILSNKAKKYGMAREVLLINTFQLYINAFSPLAISLVMVFVYRGIDKLYGVLYYPLYIRGSIYIAITAVAFAFWRMFSKDVLLYYESQVEAEIVKLGTGYVEGGVEYCTKALKRKSLGAKMKTERVRIFKYIDDFISKLVKLNGTSLESRLEFLKKHLKEKQ